MTDRSVLSTVSMLTMDPADLPLRSDSSASSDGRVHKIQKTGNNGSRLRKTGAANAVPMTRPPPAGDTKSPLRGRAKAPLGPRDRPHDFSKQSIASGTSAASTEGRSFLPTSKNEPTTITATTTTTRTANPRFSFTQQQQQEQQHQQQQQQQQPQAAPFKPPGSESSGSYDFLPSVNFDDFANSLAYGTALSNFPVPGTFKSVVQTGVGTPNNMPPSTGAPAESRLGRSNSFMRRFSQSAQRQPTTTSASAIPADGLSMPQPATNMAIRSRRQSHFPTPPLPPLPNPAARAPRKSVGPGMMPTSTFDSRHEMPRMNSDNMQTRLGRAPSVGAASRREMASANPNTTGAAPKFSNPTRSTKAKSFHPPPRQYSGHLTASSMTPDPNSITYNHTRSPGKSSAQRSHTPSSSSSKRQSTLPHLSGLGARTISPTDARRLRRMSTNPNSKPPGGPMASPTPQGDFVPEERSYSQSPAITLPNSATPSSACATPEQNRKSYASGISQSSNSSLNSLKVGGSNLPLRANPALTSSRLPTPKQRNVHSSAAGEEEDVPPVPAIPKAYESPKDPERTSFTFTTPSSKMSMPPLPSHASSPGSSVGITGSQSFDSLDTDPANSNALQRTAGSIRHRRGLTVGSGSEPDKAPVVQQSSKKNLQPIRLPPLNLLPLGTTFNSRISSFPTPAAEVDNGNLTPPPKRAVNKTPSTPMTASKATFFSKAGIQDQHDYGKQIRSSSSAVNLRTTQPPLDSTAMLESMPIPTIHPNRQPMTPFSSTPLPKSSDEFVRQNSQPTGEDKLGESDVELQSMKAGGPHSLQKRDTSDSAHTPTEPEPETPSSGSSLRRKLSLGGWRRGMSSKTTSHPSQSTHARKGSEKSDESAPQPPKHGDRLPPRLPASTTGSGAVGTSPTTTTTTSTLATNRTRPSLDSARQKTSTTTLASETDVEKPGPRKSAGTTSSTTGIRVVSNNNNNDQVRSQPAPKSSSSLLTPMQRMLGSKSSSNMLRARNLDPNLDKDDAMADEEMRKLASKRKDFEHAARDVDELRKRAKPQERVTPAQALQMVSLNIFERGEIIDYKEVYFCGTKGAKKHVGDLNAQTANFGYDDDRGDYNIVLGDHLAYRYEVVDLLGKGSFGQVVRCVDHKTGGLVAIKIIRNKKRFHQQALVEVNILQKLREWDPDNKHSMINFTQSFYFRGHLCISTELLGMNLYEFIKAHEFKGFSLRLIRRFCKQMLASLVLLKGHRVIHCDLKPENILLAHPLHSEIKVIDFGSSCFENEKVYTYIQSRFYRSPEVILGMSYGLPIDMWSLGCILAELLTGYPIFPGENEQEQLACIMEIFGPPEKHLIEKSSRKKLFFDSLGKPRVTVSTKGRRRRPSSKTLQQALKCDDEVFLDFISRCLRWDPERRMKPDEAMQHEFITGLRKTPRQRQAVSANAPSPARRVPSLQMAQVQPRARPLPEPPVTSLKNNAAVTSSRDRVPSNSPVKAVAPPRRHSTVQGQPGAAGVKRTANGVPLNVTSSLPRVAQRSVSGKPDLASAAAIASLKGR